MVKPTFKSLSPEKQDAFIQAALKEFAQHTYNDASISRIVRTLAIAKGSFYQYFEDKKALYFYLKEQAEARKRAYIQQAVAQEYGDFWELYQRLYTTGIQFDLECPLYGAFLYNFSQEKALPETATLAQSQLEEGMLFFREILREEQQKNRLNPALDPDIMAYIIMQVGRGMMDWLTWKCGIDFRFSIQQNTSLLDGGREELQRMVEEIIRTLQLGMGHDQS